MGMDETPTRGIYFSKIGLTLAEPRSSKRYCEGIHWLYKYIGSRFPLWVFATPDTCISVNPILPIVISVHIPNPHSLMKSVKILSSHLWSSQTKIVAALLVALSTDLGSTSDLRLASSRYLREDTTVKTISIALRKTKQLIRRYAIPFWNTYFQAASIRHWLAQALPSLQNLGLELVLLKLH